MVNHSDNDSFNFDDMILKDGVLIP